MRQIHDIVDALKLEHTIFALPFAYLGLWVASGGSPSWTVFGWVTLAMVGARTAGMGLNRLIDLPLDRINPRTQNWPVPAGRVRPPLLAGLSLIAAALFFFAAASLNSLCLRLAPLALLLLVFYPLTKRFTWTCHFWLGLVLAAAPLGGWLAATGVWDWTLLPLSVAVLFWVAGFDILYALLDLDFDRQHSVYSIPQRFGLKTALMVSGLCHAGAVVGLVAFGVVAGQGGWFWIGLTLVAGLLFYEHRLVTPARLNRINKDFFIINGWVAVSVFLFTLIDLKYPW